MGTEVVINLPKITQIVRSDVALKNERLRIENGKVDAGAYGSLTGVYLRLTAGQVLAVVFANLHEKETFIRVMRGNELFLRKDECT